MRHSVNGATQNVRVRLRWAMGHEPWAYVHQVVDPDTVSRRALSKHLKVFYDLLAASQPPTYALHRNRHCARTRDIVTSSHSF